MHGVQRIEELIYFADEAGNTGSNYLDPDQRYYVLAGFVLRPNQVDSARDVIRNALKGSKAAELSAQAMLRRRKLTTVTRIIRQLGQIGAVPAVSLIDKRFALGMRVADVFLDFDYNNEVNEQFRSIGLMRSASQVFADLSADTLASANAMMKDPSDSMARACCQLVVDELISSGKPWLAKKVSGALAADDLSQARKRDDDLSQATADLSQATDDLYETMRAGLSPNVAAFMNVMAMLQPLSEAIDTNIKIVHDEQVQFEAALKYFLAFAAKPEFRAHFDTLGSAPVIPMMSNIAPPTFVTSHDEPLVQAADLLAGSTNYLLRRTNDPTPWSKEEWELGLLTFGGFAIEGASNLHHYLGSDALLRRLFEVVFDARYAPVD